MQFVGNSRAGVELLINPQRDVILPDHMMPSGWERPTSAGFHGIVYSAVCLAVRDEAFRVGLV
jgi:hypothetical protein